MDFDIFTFELGDHDIPHPSAEQATLNQQPTTARHSPLLYSHIDQQKDVTCTFNDLDLLPDLDVPHGTRGDNSEWPDLTGDISHWHYESQNFDLHAENEIFGHDLPNPEMFSVDVVSTECTTPLLSPPDPDEITQPQACLSTGLETPDSTPESETQADTGKQSKRTYIPPAAKAILEEELHSNPYPNSGRISVLSIQTGLPSGTVKNWFSNNRHRKPAVKGEMWVSWLR
jgi:hypothetical protein